MGQQIGSLFANLSLESASFVNGIERAARASERNTQIINKAFDRTSLAVKGFIGSVIAGKTMEATEKYLSLADSAKQMEGQFKLATAQFGNQGVAMRQAHVIAKNTNSGLQETVSLYGKMLPAARDLGKGQDDAARATETFSKALKIGNADTNAAASATLQFGQALASGVLRGDEFNSVNEASPRIMRLLADSLGVLPGALRKMAEAGKLTSDVLFKALTDPKFTAGIDAEFRELPKTFEQAKVTAMNAATDIVGAFERGSGISTAIVNAMDEGSGAAENLAKNAESAGAEMRANFEGLGNAFQPFLDGGLNALDVLGVRVASFHDQIRSIFNGIDQIRNFLPDLQRKAQQWDEKHLGFRTGFTGNLGPRSNMEGDYERGYQKSRLKSGRERAVSMIRQWGKEKDFTGKGMTDEQVIARANQTAADLRSGKLGKGTVGSGHAVKIPTAPKKGGGGKSAAEKAEREAEREAARNRRNLEAFIADKNKSDREEPTSRADLATVGKERFAFERQQLEQERKSRMDQIDKDGPKVNKRYTEAQVAELKVIEEKITANRRERIALDETAFNQEEKKKLLDASLSNAMEMAQLDGGMARTAKDRRVSDLRLLDLKMQQEKLALESIIANRDSTEAEKEIARQRLAMLPKLRASEAKAIDKQNMGPLASYFDSLPRTAEEINEALQSVQVDGLEGLQNGLMDCIKGVGSLGDAFGDMVTSVVDGLYKIAMQQLIIKPLGTLLFGSGKEGGGSGLFGSIASGLTSILTKGKGGVPGKANGGLGNRGRVLVGEHGPELLDMGGPYHVTPNSKLDSVRGGGKPALNVTFGAITSNDPEAVKLMATEAVAQLMPMITKASTDNTMARLGRPRLA